LWLSLVWALVSILLSQRVEEKLQRRPYFLLGSLSKRKCGELINVQLWSSSLMKLAGVWGGSLLSCSGILQEDL
jgi:hypothetical protein